MVFRLPDVWRFSHARHHTDTDIVGRDPEADPRPLTMWNLFLAFFNIQYIRAEAAKLWSHVCGELTPAELTYVPASEHATAIRKARVWMAIYVAVVALSIRWGTPAPAMYVFLPYTFGAWHFVLVGVFQHAGMAQDVLDHRLNTRTCYLNPISAFIYWVRPRSRTRACHVAQVSPACCPPHVCTLLLSSWTLRCEWMRDARIRCENARLFQKSHPPPVLWYAFAPFF